MNYFVTARSDDYRVRSDGSPQEWPERYADASPAARLPLGIPQVLVLGSADNLVPLIVRQDYAQRTSQFTGAQSFAFAGCGKFECRDCP